MDFMESKRMSLRQRFLKEVPVHVYKTGNFRDMKISRVFTIESDVKADQLVN